MFVVAELLAQFADALHERVIGHNNVGPYRLVKLLLGHKAAGVLCEVTQHLERLGPQVNVLFARPQIPARQIERERVEPQNPVRALFDGAPSRPRTSVTSKGRREQVMHWGFCRWSATSILPCTNPSRSVLEKLWL